MKKIVLLLGMLAFIFASCDLTPEPPEVDPNDQTEQPSPNPEDQSFTITYDVNTEDNDEYTKEAPTPLTLKNGSVLSDSQLPTLSSGGSDYYKKHHFTFLGWYDGKEKIEAGYVVKKNLNLKAKWSEKSFVVCFYNRTSNGGQSEEWILAGNPFSLGEPFNVNKVFSHFETPSKEKIAANTIITVLEDTFLTCIWIDGVRLTYDLNTAENPQCKQQVYDRTIVKSSKITDKELPILEDTADYCFDGWYANGKQVMANDIINTPLTLVAKWYYNRALVFSAPTTQKLKVLRIDNDQDDIAAPYGSKLLCTTNPSSAWTLIPDAGAQFGGNTKLYVRCQYNNNEGTAIDSTNYLQFAFESDDVLVECSGDIRMLLKTAQFKSANTSQARFCHLFKDCKALKKAPNLGSTELADDCYFNMFAGCINLEQAPVLPATTLADKCYRQMFCDCNKLTESPILPAKILKSMCYESMFFGCKNITKITMLAEQSDINALHWWTQNFPSNEGTLYVAKGMSSKWESAKPNKFWTIVEIE